MDKRFKPSSSFNQCAIPFSDANLTQVNQISNLHSNLFQTIAYYNYNNFEIQLFVDPLSEVSGVSGLGREAVERIFVQALALWRMAKEREWDFIDFRRFQLLPDTCQPLHYTIKFPIHLPPTGNHVPEKEENTLKNLLGLFRKNKHLKDLNEKNHMEVFHRLNDKYLFHPQQTYVYRYDEFASTLLNAYPIDELRNDTNIKIRIRTADPIQEKIVKRHLYINYIAEDIFFIDIDHPSGKGGLPRCIVEMISQDPQALRPDPENLVGVIHQLDLFLKKSPFKSLVLLIDHLSSREDVEFINYLIHSSGISNIVLIVFHITQNHPVAFDLELNETPGNLLEDYLRFDKPGKKALFNEEEIQCLKILKTLPFPISYEPSSIKKIFSHSQARTIEALIQTEVLKIHSGKLEPNINLSTLDIKLKKEEELNILQSYLETTNSIKALRRLVDLLIKEGDSDLAETLILHYMERDSRYLKLKLAQVCRWKKDHPRMFQLLEEIKGNIPKKWRDEVFYLRTIYYEKISDIKTADGYFNKIQNPLFIHLANIKLSDRYIYGGDYEKAAHLLTQAIKYLERHNHVKDEIDARSQWAKLLREKQEFQEAENLYKNLFIKSQIYNDRLTSAYISVDLGNLYYFQDDFNQADVWYQKALKIFQRLKNKSGIMGAESNRVEVDKIKGNWQETKKSLKSILAYDQERKSSDAAAVDYFNIAHLDYLRHHEAGAREYLSQALKLFEEKKNINGIIECTLLSWKMFFLFHGLQGTDKLDPGLLTKYHKYLNHDQEILFSLLEKLKQGPGPYNQSYITKIKGKIDRLKSRRLRFEILTILVLSGSRKIPELLEPLKVLSMRLSNKSKNYYYYEYYYAYFNHHLKNNSVVENSEEKELFMDMYYFFLKNKRKLSPAIIKYKNHLDEKDALDDVFKSAELVGDYVQWNLPGDFFNSLVKELRKVIPSQRIQLAIYEKNNNQPVFRFSTEAKFKELTREILTKTMKDLKNLNLTLEDIKRLYKSSEKAFYYYRNTKVLPWRISNSLFGVLLLAFLKEDYYDYDIYERRPELFKTFGPLLHNYYENNYKLNRKLHWLIGESGAMKRLKEQILKVSKVDFSLLIRGESGSGKDLVARGVHLLSKRAGKPFVPVNAAAIPETLLEAELFGYKKGAFTGAAESKIGLIEAANQGTLFLDEIADLPLNLQAKMLRVLQENEIRRLGETKTVTVDFRLVCATNKNIKQLIIENRFREDLYFRIQDLTIDVPPLRERSQDIPLLVRHFLDKYEFPVKDEFELDRIIQYFSGSDYSTWTGNVRELESRVKRFITYYPDFEIEEKSQDTLNLSPRPGTTLVEARENLERVMITRAFKENNRNQSKAALALGITRQHLAKLLEKYSITKE